MTTFAVTLDEVIRRTKDDSISIPGLCLYHSLASQGRLVILCGSDEKRADWFLRTNGLTAHADLIPEDETSFPTQAERRLDQIRRLRAQGARVEFVVEPDPTIAAAIFDIGVPVMLYLHPQYSQPSFRPDVKVKGEDFSVTPWNALVERVDYQRDMRAKHTYDDEPL